MTHQDSKLRLGSLFSGYGGLDLAIENVFNAETVWHSEFDEVPDRILSAHWPDVPNLGDITKIDWHKVQPVDIIAGGSPCQDLSAAGRRAGMTEGTRSNLWVNMREAIAILRPRFVVWENVKGALSARAESYLGWTEGLLDNRTENEKPAQEKDHALRALGRVLGDLTELGYDSKWVTLRAADIGAPHGRARIFLIATNTDRGFSGVDVTTDATHGLIPAGSDITPLLRTPMAAEADGGPVSPAIAKERGQTLRLTGQILELVDRLLPTPNTMDGMNPRSDEALARARLSGGCSNLKDVRLDQWGEFSPAIARWEALTRPAPAPTQPGKNGKPQLSSRFTEWMMGLPDGWVTGHGLTRRQELKMIGNGVVPQQASAALKILLSPNFGEGLVP